MFRLLGLRGIVPARNVLARNVPLRNTTTNTAARNIVPFARRAFHSPGPVQPDLVRIQRVKFMKKRINYSRLLVFLGSFGALCICGFVYLYVTIELIDEEDEEEEGQSEQYDDDDEEELDPYFIPFPGFTQEVQPPPYRGADPEWRAFVKINRDPELQAEIRAALAELVRSRLQHPVAVSRWGSTPKISKYWFDVEYPLKPPPEFFRQGLSIGPVNGIAWEARPVESTAVFWTRHALWPSPLALSLWTFTCALVTENASAMVRLFKDEPSTNPVNTMQQTMDKIHDQLKKNGEKSGPISPPLPSQNQTTQTSTSSALPPVDKRSSGTTPTPDPIGPRTGVDNNAVPAGSSAKDAYVVRAMQEHTGGAFQKFKRKFMQTWRPPGAYPPRGSIKVFGTIEIVTSRNLMTVECIAWWDPQTKTYDRKTMAFLLKSVRPLVTAPLR
ncbi:hypothetical protein F4777DRAFT_149659 [Nemania sp. FL0916]|nr:hypothetical protein F4777DRAFT_149659 [Nemania sp. FL0916]